mmetsp:Transcript_9066/g.13963  ORF Transcript_9066/g.13963 Transcript_9066/m.13963 type:complete len:528 (+) Transcript_9066:63-1646(+)
MLRTQRRRAEVQNHRLHEEEERSRKGECACRVGFTLLLSFVSFGIIIGSALASVSNSRKKRAILIKVSSIVSWRNFSNHSSVDQIDHPETEEKVIRMNETKVVNETRRYLRIWNRAARCAFVVYAKNELNCFQNEDGTIFEVLGENEVKLVVLDSNHMLQVISPPDAHGFRVFGNSDTKEASDFEIIHSKSLRDKGTGGCLTVMRPEGSKYPPVSEVRVHGNLPHRKKAAICNTQLSIFKFQWLDTDTLQKVRNDMITAKENEKKRLGAEERMIQDTRQRWLNSTEKRIISYGLYGNDPKYCIGAIRNAELIHSIFPGWIARFYVQNDVPRDIITALRANGAEIIEMGDAANGNYILGMFWRFLVADDPSVDRFIVRDTDSRLNLRERAAVDEWIQSGKAVHSIRDHPGHNRPLNGGLFGATRHWGVQDITSKINQFKHKRNYGGDQIFLKQVVWPLVKDKQIAHDAYSCSKYPNSFPFPSQRPPNFQHVGQVFNADDEPRLTDIDTFIRKRQSPPECRKQPDWVFG